MKQKSSDRSTVRGGLGLLALRAVLGGSLVGHGAQKLFGSFGGEGLDDTAQMFDANLGLEPEPLMAALAGVNELGGGALIITGLGGPIGPASVMGVMTVAARTAHRGKPYFVQMGGPELAITNIAIASALGLTGFGRFSLDRRHHHSWPLLVRIAVMASGVACGAWVASRAQQEQATRERANERAVADAPATAGNLATERVRQSAG